MKSRILILMLSGISLMFFANNCGTKNTPIASGSLDQGSTDPLAQKVLADCSRASGQSISARLKIGKDAYGNYLASHVRLKIDAFPSSYSEHDQNEMELRLWTAAYNPATNTVTKQYDDSDSATMAFEYKSGSDVRTLQTAAAYPLRLWKVEMIDDIAKSEYNDLQDVNSPSEFFSKVTFNIDLKDEEGSYKVLDINFKDSAGNITNTTSLLIPRFEANPDEYAASHANLQILTDLHPLRSLLNSGFTTSHFYTESQKSCF